MAFSGTVHLRKEEEVLFPALQKLLGENAGALTLLKEQHRELRAALRRIAELLQEPEILEWDTVALVSEDFIDLLDDHEKKEDRLLINVLDLSLQPKELKALAGALQEVAQKAVTEEGWLSSKWGPFPERCSKSSG